jgi:hypothetical protein
MPNDTGVLSAIVLLALAADTEEEKKEVQQFLDFAARRP